MDGYTNIKNFGCTNFVAFKFLRNVPSRCFVLGFSMWQELVFLYFEFEAYSRLYELSLVACLIVDGLVLFNVLDYEEKPLELNLPCLQRGAPNPTAQFPL